MYTAINQYGIKGLFASQMYYPGDIIAEISGRLLDDPTRYSIQIARGIHIEPHNDIRFINHHCHPNSKVQDNCIVAIKKILPGEEITFNYNENEDFLSHPFLCLCCGNIIQGRKAMTKRYSFPDLSASIFIENKTADN